MAAVDVAKDVFERHGVEARQLPSASPILLPLDDATEAKRALHRLDENIGAVAIMLTDEELRDIERAASDIPIHRPRYPEAMERLSNR